MDVRELRIGNWVASCNENTRDNPETWVVGKVYSIGSIECQFEQIEVETEDEFTHFFKDSYFGIPITEQVLLDCGFKKKQDYITGVGLCYFYTKESVKYRIDSFFNIPVLSIKLKHLHQLQNLYFTLTGTELEYKPKAL